MKAESSTGIKGRVIVTLHTEESTEEIRLYRSGKLGLAFRSPAHRLIKPIGQQLRSTQTSREERRTHMGPSQSQGGSL